MPSFVTTTGKTRTMSELFTAKSLVSIKDKKVAIIAT